MGNKQRILSPEQLREEWERARTPEQLERYLDLVRESYSATQLFLEICEGCHGHFQRLPKGKRGTRGPCRSCQEHNTRQDVAKHLLSTLPGCIGVAVCTISGLWDDKREVESAGLERGSTSSVTRLLASTGWEYSQVRANNLLFEAVRRNKQIIAAVTLGIEIPRKMLMRGVERLERAILAVRERVRV